MEGERGFVKSGTGTFSACIKPLPGDMEGNFMLTKGSGKQEHRELELFTPLILDPQNGESNNRREKVKGQFYNVGESSRPLFLLTYLSIRNPTQE